jgi:hypothetical protein
VATSTPSVTKAWKEAGSKFAAGNWTARIPFDVTGAANDGDARAAVALFPPGYNIGSPHEESGLLTVSSLDCERRGQDHRRVWVNYDLGAFANSVTTPLFAPMEVEWAVQKIAAPTSLDAKNQKIVNAAGSVIVPGPPKNESAVVIYCVRNEPFADAAKAIKFSGSVNSAPFNVPGVGTFDTGQLLCDYIKPNQRYKVKGAKQLEQYLPILYALVGRRNGHQVILVNQGTEGFYNDASGGRSRGVFCDGKGNRLVNPVLLDMSGMPIDSTVKVMPPTGGSPLTPAANPKPIDAKLKYTPPVSNKSPAPTDIVFLQYTMADSIDFSGLNLK